MNVKPLVKLSAGLFADRLRKVRSAKKVTQKDLGDAIGVPQAAIARLESGRIDPRFSTLLKLADALQCRLDEFAS